MLGAFFSPFLRCVMVASLSTCYDGKGLEEAIAEPLVRYYSSLPVRAVYEPLEPEVVARWFDSPDYEVESFAVIERDTGGSSAWRGHGLLPRRSLFLRVLPA